MLRKLSPDEFDRYIDFAYALALDMTRSGYPTYADGIKTRAGFVERARRSFEREDEELLLYERGGTAAGWIQYFYLPEDRYLQTMTFSVAEGTGEAISEFLEYARARYPGSELYLGFPAVNREAVAALEALGAERIEESFYDAFDLRQPAPEPEPCMEGADIRPVTRENYEQFAALHSQNDGEMYWDTAHILDDLDHWRILALMRDGQAAAAIYYRLFDDKVLDEIVGADFPGGVYEPAAFRALLRAAVEDAQRRGAQHLVIFTEGEEHDDTLAVGFRCVGAYVCYRVEL